MRGRNWWFWYLQHSKKVWFRVDPLPTSAEHLRFLYKGRPILHHSEVTAYGNQQPNASIRPVVWGDRLGIGIAEGPDGTNLYLQLWTRWTWLNPQACGRPQEFAVIYGPDSLGHQQGACDAPG
ncbi:MAG: hypothetical protein MUD04_02820 [Cyanobium sp. Prado107]|nr:hypothetical protein [Cyanobium sp. Prado107]